MMLNDTNYIQYAIGSYRNTACRTIEDFNCDIRKFSVVVKNLIALAKGDEVNIRLLLNNLIICANNFGAYNSSTILFYRLPNVYWSYLKTFLFHLNIVPEHIVELGIYTNTIELQIELIEKLRQM
jgi:hypothetical protein